MCVCVCVWSGGGKGNGGTTDIDAGHLFLFFLRYRQTWIIGGFFCIKFEISVLQVVLRTTCFLGKKSPLPVNRDFALV